MKRFTTALKATTMAFAAASLMATSAMATDGMFGNGTGARNKALAGAGVADERDATAMSLNPAGLVHSDNMLTISASLFSPRRDATWTTPPPPRGFGVANSHSDSEYFVIPNIAYANRINATTVFGLSMYGNGGMNTDYPFNFSTGGFPGTGRMGIDLTQIFLSAGLAKSYGNFSVGIAPIVAVQLFAADGLNLAPPPGVFFASEETDVAVGVAVRGGVEWAASDSFRVGVSGVTPTYSQAFSHYKNTLFAVSDGELRIPATVQAGVALDVMPNMTIMADYKRIFYSDSKAIGTSTDLGGFGWDDINVYKVGVEWDVNPGFTLRGGYSYNDSPLPTNASAFFGNTLAPATVQHHFTGGAKMRMTDTIDLEFAGMYAPEESVSTPGSPFLPPSTVSMHQYEVTAGIVWKLGPTHTPLK